MPRRAAPHRGIDIHYGDEAGESAPERPSKTRLKQQSHDLQALGAQLAELSDERLQRAPLPDPLRDAIAEYRRTKSHEGRRRQLQFIGKLMRSADADALREAVAEATLGSARDTLALHEAERWRDALIAGDDALDRWIALYPDTDTQALRSLVRAARRDAVPPAVRRQPRSYRELFQHIRPYLST